VSDVDEKFEPVAAGALTDDRLVAGELRALRREMAMGFELVLARLDRYEGRIGDLEMHRTDANQRHERHERQLADHETRIAALEAALSAKHKEP
jgi:septal ring factor EnvC (AmiA/AmiB activator)